MTSLKRMCWVENLIAAGKAAGFTHAEMAIYSSRAIKSDLAGFNEFLARPWLSKRGGRDLARHIASEQHNRRTFFLAKGDPTAYLDSRSKPQACWPISNCARSVRPQHGLHWEHWQRRRHPMVAFIQWFGGCKYWRSSPHGGDGRLIDADYFRGKVSDQPITTGMRVPVDFEIPDPQGLDHFELVIDLVSEGIMWFEIGTSPVRKFRIDVRSDATVVALT